MHCFFGILLTFIIIFINGEDDYYKMLGITRSSTSRELRRAFKKLAIQKHPDKNRVIYFM